MADQPEAMSNESMGVLAMANEAVDQIERLTSDFRAVTARLVEAERALSAVDPDLSAAKTVLEGALALLEPIDKLGSLQNRHKIREATKTVADAIDLALSHIESCRVDVNGDSDT